MKKETEDERKQMIKERKAVEAGSFTTMTKKPTFLKSTGPFYFFKDTNSFDIGTKYMDDRDKI